MLFSLPAREEGAHGASCEYHLSMATFQNLGDLIRRDCDLDKIAVIDLGGEQPQGEFSYRALDEQTKGLARALLARAISRGARVLILSANRAEFIAAYFGIM